MPVEIDSLYQIFKMQDFEREGDPLLVRVDYLLEMFELEVQNERDKPIIITLREKDEHHAERTSKH